MTACWDGRLQVVQKLIELGEDINLRDRKPLHFSREFQDSHLTGLMYAAIQGRTDVACWLISHGADIHIKSKLGNTALGYAAPLGRTDIVEELLARGANPNDTFTFGFGVLSVLCHACQKGDTQVVESLLRHGADVNRPKRGNPFEAAVNAGSLEIVHNLLKAGAKPDNQALIEAASMGHDKIVQLLLSVGSNVNCIGYFGFSALKMTPLMWAARHGHTATVKLLLAADPSLDVVSNDLGEERLTALGFAEKQGHHEIVRILRKAGATLRKQEKPYKLRIKRGGEWVTS